MIQKFQDYLFQLSIFLNRKTGFDTSAPKLEYLKMIQIVVDLVVWLLYFLHRERLFLQRIFQYVASIHWYANQIVILLESYMITR